MPILLMLIFSISVVYIAFGDSKEEGGAMKPERKEEYTITPKLSLRGFGGWGMYYGFLSGGEETGRGSGLFYDINPVIELGLQATYSNYMNLMSGKGYRL